MPAAAVVVVVEAGSGKPVEQVDTAVPAPASAPDYTAHIPSRSSTTPASPIAAHLAVMYRGIDSFEWSAEAATGQGRKRGRRTWLEGVEGGNESRSTSSHRAGRAARMCVASVQLLNLFGAGWQSSEERCGLGGCGLGSDGDVLTCIAVIPARGFDNFGIQRE